MDETGQEGYTADQVMAALAAQLTGEERTVDHTTIERATDAEYMVRVWFVGEEDYEAYRLLKQPYRTA